MSAMFFHLFWFFHLFFSGVSSIAQMEGERECRNCQEEKQVKIPIFACLSHTLKMYVDDFCGLTRLIAKEGSYASGEKIGADMCQ